MTRYQTRNQLRRLLEDCHNKLKLYIFASLVVGFVLGKLS
jgi:hypothetical protein